MNPLYLNLEKAVEFAKKKDISPATAPRKEMHPKEVALSAAKKAIIKPIAPKPTKRVVKKRRKVVSSVEEITWPKIVKSPICVVDVAKKVTWPEIAKMKRRPIQ